MPFTDLKMPVKLVGLFMVAQFEKNEKIRTSLK